MMSGVAFSKVRPIVFWLDSEPSISAPYASMGLAPETARMMAPIPKARATATRGTATGLSHLKLLLARWRRGLFSPLQTRWGRGLYR